MQRILGITFYALLTLVCLSRLAFAEEVQDLAAMAPQFVNLALESESYPFVSKERASVGAIVGREWVTNTSSADPVTQLRAEWKAGVSAAYNLISPSSTSPHLPHVSLNGRSVFGLDSRQFQSSIYLVWRVWSGKSE